MAIIPTWNKEESNPSQVKPGDFASPGFLVLWYCAKNKEAKKKTQGVNTCSSKTLWGGECLMICYYDVLTDLGHCFRSAIGSLLLPLLSCGYILSDVLRHRSCPYSRWHKLIYGLCLPVIFHRFPLVLGCFCWFTPRYPLPIHHARSLAYLTVVVCPSLFSSYTGTVLMRSVNSTFSFPF